MSSTRRLLRPRSPDRSFLLQQRETQPGRLDNKLRTARRASPPRPARPAGRGSFPRRFRRARRRRSRPRTRPTCPRPAGSPTSRRPSCSSRRTTATDRPANPTNTSSGAHTSVTTTGPGSCSLTTPSSPAATSATSRNTRMRRGQIRVPHLRRPRQVGPDQDAERSRNPAAGARTEWADSAGGCNMGGQTVEVVSVARCWEGLGDCPEFG